jgi:alpha-1,6-mannosyltransferase
MALGAVGHLLGQPEWRDWGISTMRALGLVVMVALLVLLWLRAARRMNDRVFVVRSIGFALLAVIVLAPAFLGWYFLWVLPILAATTSPVEHPRQVTGLAVVASVLCFAQLPDGYSLGLTTTAVGVPIALVLTVLLVRTGWRWARSTAWSHVLELPARDAVERHT